MDANRVEAERLLGIAEKLLQVRDLNGSKEFAVLAQETEPLLEGSDQILAVVEVLLASEKRLNNQHHDWYGILQVELRCDDLGAIRRQYRRLALLLHPDKNKFPMADQAFRLVAHAWAVLSDPSKKSLYDKDLTTVFSRVDLTSQQPQQQQHVKLPVRRTTRHSANDDAVVDNGGSSSSPPPPPPSSSHQQQRMRLQSFWTACPYCYALFEYPRVYEDCCLRCQKCRKAFHASMIPTMPPLVPGQDAYYCCWGFFPLGYVFGGSSENGAKGTAGFPNWMPPFFQNPPPQQHHHQDSGGRRTKGGSDGDVVVDIPDDDGPSQVVTRKKGRPRKNPIY